MKIKLSYIPWQKVAQAFVMAKGGIDGTILYSEFGDFMEVKEWV